PSGGVAPLTYRWTWTSSNTGCAEQTITVTPQTATPPYIAASWDTSKLPPNGCSAGIGILKVYATDSLNQVGASPGVSFDLFVIN
ncbi:MAG: hypothetical protein ACXWK8_06625, partial [Myxococcaceae bacterium]